MNCAVLFSGGKDSTYAAYIAKKNNYNISCLISIFSENPESYMFHTPSISKVEKQAEIMEKPLIIQKTKGEKEIELDDLFHAIMKAKYDFNINGVITGTVESAYQASRIQKICYDLELECFNPLWQKNQVELIKELIEKKFYIIITGVFAYPFDKSWLGKKIDQRFLCDIEELYEKYKINPAGEGGEYETFVLNCPLFKKELKIVDKKIYGKNHSWKMEIDAE